MKHLLVAFALTGCAISDEPELDIDDAIDDAGDGKADSAPSRHYLLTGTVFPGEVDARTLVRAGGGTLRCPNGELAEACAIHDGDLVTTPGLKTPAAQLLDEALDTAIILRGRIVRNADGFVQVRATAATRAITTVLPEAPCFRMRPTVAPANCTDPFCFDYRLEQLDTTKATEIEFLYLDDVDPTPDFWGQATPAVQAKIDAGLVLSKTRPVYTCGGFEQRNGEDWFWGHQLFVPNN